MTRRFLFVTRDHRGRESFAIYESEPPPAQQQKHGMTVLYKRELVGEETGFTVDQAELWYRQHVDAGTLPPTNMVPPKRAAQETRRSFETKRTWRTGDLYRQLREGKS